MSKLFKPLALVVVIAFAISGTALAGSSIRHPNGQLAWDGDRGHSVRHSNGQLAWDGDHGHSIRHSNGQLAWDGDPGHSVRYSNGQLAWDGDPGHSCRHANGSLISSDCHGINMALGEGISLSVSRYDATVFVYGVALDAM